MTRARLALPLPLLLLILVVPARRATSEDPRKRPDLLASLKLIDSEIIKRDLFYLASDDMGGRETGSMFAHKAAMYIAEHYEREGMTPKGTDGYFQPFGTVGTTGEMKDCNYLRVTKNNAKPVELEYERHFKPARFSGTGIVEGDLIFCGYAVAAKDLGYDDFAGQKVQGKIVVALDREPQDKDPKSVFDGDKPTKHSDLKSKAEAAIARGAAALLIVRDATKDDKSAYPTDDELAWPPTEEKLGIPVAYLSVEATAALCAALGRKDFAGLQKRIDESGKPASQDLKGVTARFRIGDKPPIVGGQKNIIALKEGLDPVLKDEYVILSAHYDHIGLGNPQNSRGPHGKIHNGSDDNGSGTTGLMQLATALRELKTKRSLLLINFDAEEAGLIGSKHFADKPTVPMEKIVAILNMDMISRNKSAAIEVGGIGRNPVLDKVLKDVSGRYGLKMETDGMEQYLNRSDQWALMEKGVPGIFFFGGMHSDYHTPDDDPEKANITKIKLITMVCLVFLDEVGNGESPRK